MLVLTRKSGECVQIGNSVSVKVLSISGNHVRLGFSAPAEVAIRREEIIDAVPIPLGRWQEPSAEKRRDARAVC
jgi:carbon storage regulator